MVLPSILILLAAAAAAVVAYGTHPDWIVYDKGMTIITASHRLQWPLTFLAIVLCVALVALVASGKRRVFWLLGLAPVAALLVYHFRSGPMRGFAVADNPPFVNAAQAGGMVADDEYVVGLQLGETAYAYPYSLLYGNPAVLHAERGRRLLLMWSAFANHASAYYVDRDVRGPELAIVSMPANALLLYNGRLGQFINGVTGLTPWGAKPGGFGAAVATTKTTWKQWRAAHPATKVLAAPPRYAAGLPRRAVVPYFKTPGVEDGAGGEGGGGRVTVINPGPAGVAIPVGQIRPQPLNLTPDAGPAVVVFRDEQAGVVRAFDRRVDAEVVGEFRPVADGRRAAGVVLVDTVTRAGWSSAGRVVDGDQKFRGMRLAPVPVDEDVPLGVMKYWFPKLEVREVGEGEYAKAEEAVAGGAETPPQQPVKPRPVRRRTARSR